LCDTKYMTLWSRLLTWRELGAGCNHEEERPRNGNQESGNFGRVGEVHGGVTTEGANRRGTVLGAAPLALQLFAFRRRCDLAGKNVATFSPCDDLGVTRDHDRAGAACECLLLRGVPRGASDSERQRQRGLEPPAVGRLGRRNVVRDRL